MFETVREALDALTKKHPRKIDLSLGRLSLILERLENPHKALPPTIHVAGTNGKGSTTAFMRSILEAAGFKVHVYTSPHLVRFNERIRLSGTLIDDVYLIDVLSQVHKAAADDPITFFEATTAAAFLAFSQRPADALILEVGLGGRFDATNIIERAELGVVTPVSLDHMEFLGPDIKTIAYEKAGIARRDVPLVIHQPSDDAQAVIEAHARDIGALPVISGRHFTLAAGKDGAGLEYRDARGALALPKPVLQGRFQAENAALAVAALRHQAHWSIPDSAYSAGLRWASWPARLQPLQTGSLVKALPEGSTLWLDGGHNEAAGAAVAAFLKSQKAPEQPVHLVLGMLSNKDLKAYLKPFKDIIDELWWMPVRAHPHHSFDAMKEAAAMLDIEPIQGRNDIQATLKTLSAAIKKPATIMIAGSLYLAGDVLGANGTPPD